MPPRTRKGSPQQVPTKKGRYYTDPKDTAARYISVTNILSTALNKPALVGWAAKTVAQEAVAQLPKLTQLARVDEAAAVTWLKGSPYEKKDAAAKLGSRVHDLAEKHALGLDLGEIEPDALAVIEQYRCWVEDFHPDFEATEATVVNRTLGYAGTLDGLIRLPAQAGYGEDTLCVLDYKTGATGPYGEWALQLSAYANAEALWLPDGTEVPMPKVDRALVLRLRPDFYALHEMRLDEDTFAAFTQMAAFTRFVHDDLDACAGGKIMPTAATTLTAVA